MLPDEEPIKLYIYPFLTKHNMVSHAAMAYKGEAIDYSSQGFQSVTSAGEDADVYWLYPSELGIKPEKLLDAMKKRKEKIKGDDYQYLGENCAKQVIACLEEAGVKNIPKVLGISVPSLPVLDDLGDWAGRVGYYKGKKLSYEKTDEYKEQFCDCLSILCDRTAFKEKMEHDLRRVDSDLVKELKKQSSAVFKFTVKEKPTEDDIKLYNKRKLLLMKSEDELLDMIVSISNESCKDCGLKEYLDEFAMSKAHNMSDKVWKRLKKEGVVYGERYILPRGKNVKKDSTNRIKESKLPFNIMGSRVERNIT